MRDAFCISSLALLTLAFAISGQSVPAQNPQTTPAPPAQAQTSPQTRSPGGDVGSGAGDIGKGAAKGTGAAAKGVGKGAGDLVTLHPIDAQATSAKAQPSPEKTSASVPPKAQAKSPREQVAASAKSSTRAARPGTFFVTRGTYNPGETGARPHHRSPGFLT